MGWETTEVTHSHGHPHGQPPLAPTPPRNGLGLAALIVGIAAVLAAIIPFVNLTAWIVGFVGLGLALGALSRVRRARATNKGMAVTGLVASVLAIVISTATIVAVGNAVTSSFAPPQVSAAVAAADDSVAPGRYAGGTAVDVEGLVLTVETMKRTAQQFGSPALCVDVRYVNNSDENQSYNGGFDWKLQSPEGQVAGSTLADGALSAGEIVPGAQVSGKVCFTDTEQRGEHVMIYEPLSLRGTHVEWTVTR